MINLMPYDNRRELRAGRRNLLLLRYLLITVAGSVFLLAASMVTYLYLLQLDSIAKSTIEDNQIKEKQFDKTKENAELFRSKLAKAKTILDSQVRYSTALLSISKLFPDDTAIDSITLNEESFTTGNDLVVKLKNKQAADALEKTLKNDLANGTIISSYKLGDVVFSDEDGKYPYQADLNLVFKKEIAQ